MSKTQILIQEQDQSDILAMILGNFENLEKIGKLPTQISIETAGEFSKEQRILVERIITQYLTLDDSLFINDTNFANEVLSIALSWFGFRTQEFDIIDELFAVLLKIICGEKYQIPMLPRVIITEDAVNKAVSAFGQASIITQRDSEKIERGELDLKIGLKIFRRELETVGVNRVKEYCPDMLIPIQRILQQNIHD